jgi:hypothetical protein
MYSSSKHCSVAHGMQVMLLLFHPASRGGLPKLGVAFVLLSVLSLYALFVARM